MCDPAKHGATHATPGKLLDEKVVIKRVEDVAVIKLDQVSRSAGVQAITNVVRDGCQGSVAAPTWPESML